MRHLRQKRSNCERCFRLSHENAGGNVEGFRAARAHQSGHHDSGNLDDELHHTEVIENRKKRSDKNDRWQHLKREEKAHRRTFFAEVTEYERRTVEREIEHPVHAFARLVKDPPTVFPAHHEKCENDLKPQTPRDGLFSDGAAVRRKKKCERHQNEHSNQANQAMHSMYSPRTTAGITGFLPRQSLFAREATRAAVSVQFQSFSPAVPSNAEGESRDCSARCTASRLTSRDGQAASRRSGRPPDRSCLPFSRGRRPASCWRRRPARTGSL